MAPAVLQRGEQAARELPSGARDRRLRDHVHVRSQERFAQGGGTLLDQLDLYIARRDAVGRLLGDACGASPKQPKVDSLLARNGEAFLSNPPGFGAFGDRAELSYTQWQAVLALRTSGRALT